MEKIFKNLENKNRCLTKHLLILEQTTGEKLKQTLHINVDIKILL